MSRDSQEGSEIGAAEEHQPLVRHEEVSAVAKTWRPKGSVRARKHVESVPVRESVPVEVERIEVEYVGAGDGDSGEIETLADGSISIPVYEEELVITRRPLLRERVVIRKHTATERVTVTDELRRERVEIDADDGLEDWIEIEPERPSATAGGVEGEQVIRASGGERPWFDFERPREAKPAFLTSEFVVLFGVLAAIAVATWLADALDAVQAWLLITVVVIAYLLARGFAKAGSQSASRR